MKVNLEQEGYNNSSWSDKLLISNELKRNIWELDKEDISVSETFCNKDIVEVILTLDLMFEIVYHWLVRFSLTG